MSCKKKILNIWPEEHRSLFFFQLLLLSLCPHPLRSPTISMPTGLASDGKGPSLSCRHHSAHEHTGDWKCLGTDGPQGSKVLGGQHGPVPSPQLALKLVIYSALQSFPMELSSHHLLWWLAFNGCLLFLVSPPHSPASALALPKQTDHMHSVLFFE